MYHPTSIAPLSSSQISKALKGLPVRISAGNQHDIELSADQFKKFAKAHQKGKASTITMDPYQIQNHMHILGSGVLKKSARTNAGRLITAGTDRAIRYLGGNVIATSKNSAKRLITAGTDRAIRALDGSGFGGNIIATSKDSGKRLIVAGTDRAVRALDGSGVNRLKKAGRWEQFANATIRDGIDTAGKAANVYYDSSNPMAQMGFGLKKRGRPRRRMSGSALYPAGVY
jgi:hypothetical protein